MIEINERIEVPSAPAAVWALLSDPGAVVECVPGATLGARHEDGSYDAGLVVKFGPAKVTFNTRVELEMDPATQSGQVSARGKDNQGGTRVKAAMHFQVLANAATGGASVPVKAEVEIGGRLAHLIESGASFVVRHMTEEFTKRVAERLGAKPPQ